MIMSINEGTFLLFTAKYPNEFGNLFHALDIWHKSVKLTKKLAKVTRTYYTVYCFISGRKLPVNKVNRAQNYLMYYNSTSAVYFKFKNNTS